MALAVVLVLGACRAEGGGYIGEPLEGGPVSVFQGDANFGFNFTCEMNRRAKRALIRGEITYHDSPSTIGGVEFPAIRLHGTVEPLIVADVPTCKQAVEMIGVSRRPCSRAPTGPRTGRSVLWAGEFIVQVFDQGEPGSPQGEFTGDEFSIELIGGAYNGYTRAGYIEGGNVQVES